MTTTYDGAERPSTVSRSLNGNTTNYVTQSAYWPQGAIYYFVRGNGLWSAAGYNDRLQPSEFYEAVNNANSTNSMLFYSCLDWGVTESFNNSLYQLCSPANTHNDNGTLLHYGEYDGGPGNSQYLSFTQTFTYDGANRLSMASEGSNWSRSYGYDQYGNMWVTGATGVTPAGNTPTSNVYANNRINSASYDAAGNQTVVNGDTLTYDAENRMISAYDPIMHSTETYVYDGNGQRVQKSGPGGTTTYVYDAFGNLAAEYGAAPSAPCTTCYLSYDHLGSVRLVTDQNANVVARHDYLPFGEEIPANTAGRNGQWGSTNDVEQKFTGQIRDQETGLDFFGARYYGNALGRFTSPDPVTATPLHIVNPQRWNMYAYAMDDPLAFTDPDGRDAIAVNFSKEVPIGGHEGIMSVHKDGSVQYARFGPEGGDRPFAPGAVNWVDADFKVQFGPNGIPTDASYKQLANFAAKIEGQDPNTVRMNYFKTSEADTLSLDAWMKRIAEASVHGKAPSYDVTRQNCATFCIAGLIQGNAIQNKGPLSMVPNLLFELLINRAADTYPHQDQNKETVSKSHKDCLIDRNTGNCVQ